MLIEAGDFNFDCAQEVRLENDRLIAWVSPASRGPLYELDIRETASTFWPLSIADPKPTTPISWPPWRREWSRPRTNDERFDSDGMIVKQPGLDDRLWSTTAPAESARRPFLPPVDLTLMTWLPAVTSSLAICAWDVARESSARARAGSTVMERPGRAEGHAFRIKKTIELLAPVSRAVSVHYEFDELPVGVCLHFAAEINVAALAGHAPDRFYADRAVAWACWTSESTCPY